MKCPAPPRSVRCRGRRRLRLLEWTVCDIGLPGYVSVACRVLQSRATPRRGAPRRAVGSRGNAISLGRNKVSAGVLTVPLSLSHRTTGSDSESGTVTQEYLFRRSKSTFEKMPRATPRRGMRVPVAVDVGVPLSGQCVTMASRGVQKNPRPPTMDYDLSPSWTGLTPFGGATTIGADDHLEGRCPPFILCQNHIYFSKKGPKKKTAPAAG